MATKPRPAERLAVYVRGPNRHQRRAGARRPPPPRPLETNVVVNPLRLPWEPKEVLG